MLRQPILDIVVREGFSPIEVHYDHRSVGAEPLGHIVENRAIRTCPDRAGAVPADCRRWRRRPRSRRSERPDGAGRGPARRRPQRCRAAGGPVRGPPVEHARADRHRRPAMELRADRHRLQRAHEKPHHGLAVERFFPDGPFARLPMTGNRCSIVWALDDDLSPSVLALDDTGFLGEVAERFGDDLGELALASPRWSYPLALVLADRYTAHRAVLVGDAARGIHPIAGQGWNLALRDVAAVAEIVVDRLRLGLDPGEAWPSSAMPPGGGSTAWRWWRSRTESTACSPTIFFRCASRARPGLALVRADRRRSSATSCSTPWAWSAICRGPCAGSRCDARKTARPGAGRAKSSGRKG